MQRIVALMTSLVVALPLWAQITLPVNVSQRGALKQRIGVTDITIDYGRPAVNGREVWGALVPYDQVWRAGANENTTFTTTTDVKIHGKDLPAGTYGLHMIPGKTEWTLIFSRQAHAWGSYFYDKAQDALRVSVAPVPAPHTEILTFDAPSVTEDGALLQLRWEKVAVPIMVSVDLAGTVTADLQRQLTGVAGFNPMNYAQAADWVLQHKGDIATVKAWIARASQGRPTFISFKLQASLADHEGNATKASELRAKAVELGTNQENNLYGYELLNQGRKSEGLSILDANAKRFPTDPNAWDSLGEAYALNENKTKALECFNKALSMNPPPEVRRNSEQWLKKLQ